MFKDVTILHTCSMFIIIVVQQAFEPKVCLSCRHVPSICANCLFMFINFEMVEIHIRASCKHVYVFDKVLTKAPGQSVHLHSVKAM